MTVKQYVEYNQKLDRMEKALEVINRQVEKRHARERYINDMVATMERQVDTMVKRNRESLSNPSTLFGSTKVDPCVNCPFSDVCDGECEE